MVTFLSATATPSKPFALGTVTFAPNALWGSKARAATAFQRGALLAASLRRQSRHLKAARACLAYRDNRGARLELDAWKLERAYYAHLLAAQQGRPLPLYITTFASAA